MTKKKKKQKIEKTTPSQSINNIYQSGLLHFSQGEYEKAIHIWERIANTADIKILISLAEAYFRNAMTKYVGKDEKDVISELYKAVKYMPDNPLYLYHIGLAYHRMSKFQNAISFYKKALEISPKNERYLYHLGLAYLENGEYEKSIETFNSIENQQGVIGKTLAYIYISDYDNALKVADSKNKYARFLEGLIYLIKGEDKEAKSLLKKAADEIKDNGIADYYLGIAHARTGTIPSAAQSWENALRKGSDIRIMEKETAEIYRHLIPRYFDRGDLDKVVKIWEKLIEIDQNDTETKKNLVHAYFLRGNDYAKEEKFNYAVKYWEKAWEIDPDNVDLAHNIAIAYESMDKFDNAAKFWKEASIGWKKRMSMLKPEEKEMVKLRLYNIHIHLADISLKEDNVERAIMEYIQALRYNPNDIETMTRLADLYMSVMRFSMAIKQLLEARRLKPEDTSILQMLSVAYAMNHEIHRSIQCVKDILKIDPDNKDARELLTEYYIDASEDALFNRNYKRALIILQEGLDSCPGSVEIQASMGSIYLVLKDEVKAEELFNNAINMKPEDPKSYLIVAHFCLDKDMLAKAEEYIKKAVDIDPKNYQIYIDIAIEYLNFDFDDKAVKYLQMAEKIRPNDITLIEEIINNLMKNRFYEQAVLYADKLINMKPNLAKHFLLAADVYNRAEKEEMAIDILERGKKIAKKAKDHEILDEMNRLENIIRFNMFFRRLGGTKVSISNFLESFFEEEDEENN